MITLEKTSSTFAVVNVTRRSFLQGALSASAFVLCVAKAPLFAKAAGNVAPQSTSNVSRRRKHNAFTLFLSPEQLMRQLNLPQAVRSTCCTVGRFKFHQCRARRTVPLSSGQWPKAE